MLKLNCLLAHKHHWMQIRLILHIWQSWDICNILHVCMSHELFIYIKKIKCSFSVHHTFLLTISQIIFFWDIDTNFFMHKWRECSLVAHNVVRVWKEIVKIVEPSHKFQLRACVFFSQRQSKLCISPSGSEFFLENMTIYMYFKSIFYKMFTLKWCNGSRCFLLLEDEHPVKRDQPKYVPSQ